MNIETLTHDAVPTIGIAQDCALGDKEGFQKAWETFMSRSKEMPESKIFYGVSIWSEEQMQNQKMTYIAALPFKEGETYPDDLRKETIPAGLYAKLTYKGVIAEIYKGYGVFFEWLKTSDYKQNENIFFELYDERFIGESNPDSEIDIYFSIVKK